MEESLLGHIFPSTEFSHEINVFESLWHTRGCAKSVDHYFVSSSQQLYRLGTTGHVNEALED